MDAGQYAYECQTFRGGIIVLQDLNVTHGIEYRQASDDYLSLLFESSNTSSYICIRQQHVTMELHDAKEKFIQAWGSFGSQWGINRSMAQVHALLLVSAGPISTEDVMQQLNISRGNANMNLRALIDWTLVRKVLKSGERMEYFEAEKDVWKVATAIARERKKRELEPMLLLLNDLKRTEGNSADARAFRKTTADLHDLTSRLDSMLERSLKSDVQWFLKAASTLLR
jgi:DNA-binding transcriptional regulator GbsR (MarR family)